MVRFDDGRTCNCSEGLLNFISKTIPTHCLVKEKNGEMIVEKIDEEFEDREAILDVILQIKMRLSIGYCDISYNNLALLFKPQYASLTASKLCKHVSVSHKFLVINTSNKPSSSKTRTWLNELSLEDDSEKSESSSKIADRNHRPGKRIVRRIMLEVMIWLILKAMKKNNVTQILILWSLWVQLLQQSPCPGIG